MKKIAFTKRLRTRYVTLFLTLAVAVAAIIGWFGIKIVNETMNSSAREQFHFALNITENFINIFL